MGITNKDVLKTVAIDVPNLKTQMDSIESNRCNNNNFTSKIKSNTTLLLTEDIVLDKGLEFRGISNTVVKSETGKTTITASGNYIFHIINSNNITFENIIFNFNDTSIEWGAVTLQQNAKNIQIKNCDFKTKKSNGVTVWCTLDSGTIEDVTVKNCTFNTGRMGVECVNHIEDVTRRYKNINIINNKFETFGVDNNAMGVSLSGYGEANTVENNSFYSSYANAIGIELVGCCSSVFTKNNFFGDFKSFSASNIRPMDKLTISNNTMLNYNNKAEVYLYNINNSIISDNNFGYTRLIRSQNIKLINNLIESYNGTAIIFDNTNNCVSVNNTYSTKYSVSNSTVISFNGLECKNNYSKTDTLIKSTTNSGGTYYNEVNNASNNIVSEQIVDGINYPSNNRLQNIFKKELTSNSVTFTVTPVFRGISERIGGVLEYCFVLCNKDNNNVNSECIKGVINFHLLLDPTPFMPNIHEIVTSSSVSVLLTRDNKNLVFTITTTNSSLNQSCGFFELKCLGGNQIIVF